MHRDLMAPPPDVRLDEDPDAEAMLRAGTSPADVASIHPHYSEAWAQLAKDALERREAIEAYAYGRTGYHRGLDALRRAGWKGFGPVPYAHDGNRGVLRSIYYLAQAAERIEDFAEVDRLTELLNDCDPTAADQIAAES